MELRQKFLPEWANTQRFNHFLPVAVNTSIPRAKAGKRWRAGDAVEFLASIFHSPDLSVLRNSQHGIRNFFPAGFHRRRETVEIIQFPTQNGRIYFGTLMLARCCLYDN